MNPVLSVDYMSIDRNDLAIFAIYGIGKAILMVVISNPSELPYKFIQLTL